MKTIRLTMAQALVKWLCAQRTVIDGAEAPLFGGVFAIFGHGNVTCLGEALEAVQDRLPTWRGQNEQSMALAGVAYAKAKKRRQIMVATSSIGPGAMNLVTAAGVAHSNRLPILLLSGDTFANRVPDPVLQQVEHFHDPTITVNDAFKAVDPLLGPDRAARADHRLAAAGDRHHARSGRLRPRVPRPVPGHARGGVRLPRGVLRAEAVDGAAAAARRRAAGRGRRAPAQGGQAADRRGRRRALFARDRRARDLRRDPPRAGGRDHRRARLPAPRPSEQRRAARRDRQRLGQRACRRGGRGARGRHAAPGLHHRLLDRVRQPRGQADRAERRPVRCRQAPGARGGRRRQGGTDRAVGRARRLARAAGLARARGTRVRGVEPHGRSALRADQRPAAVLCAGGRRDQPRVRSDRSRAHRRGRAAGRAVQELEGEVGRHLRLRVRLLVHGLRDRGRLGRQDGRARARRHRVHGRWLVPDDELRHLLVGADRPQADRRGLRQRRLRGDRPPPELQGQRLVQQPARGLPARARRAGRFRQARREHGRDRREGDIDRRSRGGVPARQGRRSHLRRS